MINLKNITAGYNKIEVIKDINISFEKGAITTIIGKNGCGKSTLLKVSSNILKPFYGEVMISGKNICNITRNELAKEISFLPQIRSVPNITVYNLVMHGRFPYLGFSRIPKEKDKLIVENSIDKMGLADLKNRNIHELSGGERQKVYISMILAQDTDIIFLDEPTTYLDINHQLEILEIIKELKEMGKTIIMVLHDLGSAISCSDKICLMDKGKIIIYDTPEEVINSKQLERVFKVSCEKLYTMNGDLKQYVFTLKDK